LNLSWIGPQQPFEVADAGSAHPETVANGYRVGLFECGSFTDLSFQSVVEPVCVVGKDCRLVAGTGDSDISESRTEQVGMHSIQVGAHLGVCYAAHGATEAITDQSPFIDHRFALNVLVACERQRFADAVDGLDRSRLMLNTLTGSTDDVLGPMAEKVKQNGALAELSIRDP
jgi:hypothetical protein